MRYSDVSIASPPVQRPYLEPDRNNTHRPGAWHRNMHRWIVPYLMGELKKSLRKPVQGRLHVMFCVADHFEPYTRGASPGQAEKRLKRWTTNLPALAEGIVGSDGKPYRHTFFYPREQYSRTLLNRLAEICRAGLAEVEIHLHHDNAASEELRADLLHFKRFLRQGHGLLSADKNTGEVKYAFIHGNWALDNSRPDGRYCGVNNELIILKETGCYADFTLPSAPSATQTAKINSIYYAKDNPRRPRSHNTGIDVRTGARPRGDLLLIQGPLALDWKALKKGILPGIENAEIGGGRPPTIRRFDLWKRQHISVAGRPEWIFIKVHCHGALEKNADMFFHGEMRLFLEHLVEHARQSGFSLHFVTAREMYNIIKAAEAGENGDPGAYRDYVLV